eukprot:scaffold31812_cov58-Phaeocystis_antarctica.AAC.4
MRPGLSRHAQLRQWPRALVTGGTVSRARRRAAVSVLAGGQPTRCGGARLIRLADLLSLALQRGRLAASGAFSPTLASDLSAAASMRTRSDAAATGAWLGSAAAVVVGTRAVRKPAMSLRSLWRSQAGLPGDAGSITWGCSLGSIRTGLGSGLAKSTWHRPQLRQWRMQVLTAAAHLPVPLLAVEAVTGVAVVGRPAEALTCSREPPRRGARLGRGGVCSALGRRPKHAGKRARRRACLIDQQHGMRQQRPRPAHQRAQHRSELGRPHHPCMVAIGVNDERPTVTHTDAATDRGHGFQWVIVDSVALLDVWEVAVVQWAIALGRLPGVVACPRVESVQRRLVIATFGGRAAQRTHKAKQRRRATRISAAVCVARAAPYALGVRRVADQVAAVRRCSPGASGLRRLPRRLAEPDHHQRQTVQRRGHAKLPILRRCCKDCEQDRAGGVTERGQQRGLSSSDSTCVPRGAVLRWRATAGHATGWAAQRNAGACEER